MVWNFRVIVLISTMLLLTGCYHEPKTLYLDSASAYIYEPPKQMVSETQDDLALFEKFCPIFVVEKNEKPYNKIGQPKIKRGPQKKLEAFVDPSSHPIYVQKVNFVTKKGEYTNLIYRVHFEKVPYGLRPFQVTAGKNVGLLVIITLNSQQLPILVTSVHTCGCYISMIPTNHLSPDAFPRNWKDEPTYRYGEKYPAMVDYPCPMKEGAHPVFFLRNQTHRVTDVYVENTSKVRAQYNTAQMPLVQMNSLEDLPIEGEDKTLSFYYDELNKGYVRNSLKPFEFLMISWWAFDPNVGCDKRYAPANQLMKRFYTSLNPAYWRESDLWNFPVAARFWGWEL